MLINMPLFFIYFYGSGTVFYLLFARRIKHRLDRANVTLVVLWYVRLFSRYIFVVSSHFRTNRSYDWPKLGGHINFAIPQAWTITTVSRDGRVFPISSVIYKEIMPYKNVSILRRQATMGAAWQMFLCIIRLHHDSSKFGNYLMAWQQSRTCLPNKVKHLSSWDSQFSIMILT